jgi:hypothetical protein
VAAVEGVEAAEKSSRQFGIPSMGSPFPLAFAALFEAFGDSLLQSGIHRAGGVPRVFFLASGAMILGLYGFTVNIPDWDFGKLLGIYVVMFFSSGAGTGQGPV